jgi:hypothetical protein
MVNEIGHVIMKNKKKIRKCKWNACMKDPT